MSQLISLSKDKSIWRYEKEMDCEWKRLPGPPLLPFNTHRFMTLNIDGHQLEIDAVYENRPHFIAAATVCHLDTSFVGSNGACIVWSVAGGGGSLGWLTKGSPHFMYVEVGDTLLRLSNPRLVEREATDPIYKRSSNTRQYRMINPTVQIWSRAKPETISVPGAITELEEQQFSLKFVPMSKIPGWPGHPFVHYRSEPKSWLAAPLEHLFEPIDHPARINRLRRLRPQDSGKNNKKLKA